MFECVGCFEKTESPLSVCDCGVGVRRARKDTLAVARAVYAGLSPDDIRELEEGYARSRAIPCS